MRVFAALTILLSTWLTPAAGRAPRDEPRPFVFENGTPDQIRDKDGVMTLHNGTGWLRSRQVFNDFVLTVEFRLKDEHTDAGVGLRTLSVQGGWPGAGYRLALTGSPGLIQSRNRRATVVQSAPLPAPAAQVWHQLVVAAEGPRITVTLDGGTANVTTIDDLVGCVLFDVRRGSMDLRNLKLRPLPISIEALRTEDQTGKAGFEPPRVRKEVKPNYTRSAFDRKVEGVVELDAIVLEDGRVGPIWITKLPDPDLEQSAVAALSHWLFWPAKENGVAVPIRVQVQLTFTLR